MITYDENIAEEEKGEIAEILPQWETYVLQIQKNSNNSELESINFLVAATCREEFRQWLSDFETKTKMTYSIRHSRTGNGQKRRVCLKLLLHCHHNTQNVIIHNSGDHKVTKNTNCPSKMTVTVYAVNDLKRPSRGKFANIAQLHRRMPCEVKLTLNHNHSTRSASALKFRKPSKEVTDTLKSLFEKGHSPASALESIKTDIQLNYSDFPSVLGDRSMCPDYNYCYSLYSKICKKKYGPMNFNREGKEVLQQRLEEYNNEVGSVCSKMVVKEDDYIICICSPLMKRVHTYIKAASNIVFMDSTGTLDRDGSRVFVLLTHSECGGLPLGIIVTSSESTDMLETGLKTLKDIVGVNIFGGNICGPSVFLTDDCKSEQSAIRSCFPHSKVFLCSFHVLQAVWRWLIKSKNKIPQESQNEFFQDFRKIMFAKTASDAEINYHIAKGKICDKHQNYAKYLEGYWTRREQWAISYRRGTFIEGHNTNNISEAFMRILKDNIFKRVQAFNVVQLVDFIITKVNLYFQRRLLGAANRTSCTSFYRPIKVPSQEILTKIKQFNDGVLWVPSEHIENHYYIVNMNVLICSCTKGNTGKICKHIDWGSVVCPSESYMEVIDSNRVRTLLYFVATGEQPPENWMQPLQGSATVTQLKCADSETMQTEVINEFEGTVTDETDEDMSHIENVAIIQKFTSALTQVSKRSPTDLKKGLQVINTEMEKTKTPSAWGSWLMRLQTERSRRNTKNKIPIQATAIGRRKKKGKGHRKNLYPPAATVVNNNANTIPSLLCYSEVCSAAAS